MHKPTVQIVHYWLLSFLCFLTYTYSRPTRRRKHMDFSDIGNQIRAKRKAKSWSQEKLAEEVHLSAAYIGMIERGEKIPTLETFSVIANALEASADELLFGVISASHEARMSKYAEQMRSLDFKSQKVLQEIIEIFLKNYPK